MGFDNSIEDHKELKPEGETSTLSSPTNRGTGRIGTGLEVARQPRIRVLMVTGAYFPEISGAGLQCRSLIHACGDSVIFSVLTTAVDSSLPEEDQVDGVRVRRVLVSARHRAARFLAAPRLIRACVELARSVDIVHLHGFSAKSRVVMALARLLDKRIIIKLTSVGHDDPLAIRAQGRGLFRAVSRADRFVAVSPAFEALYVEAGLPTEKFRLIPNGVDVDRFRPPSPGDRLALRVALGLPADLPLVLFVGFFSREKCPDLLFDAWTDTFGVAPASGLVMVGRTESDYYEIDQRLAERVRADAERLGCADRLFMIEQTYEIEKYYGAADLFVLPSVREGLPNVALEAMASGLPCIVSRLPGVTDALVTEGVDGLLVGPRDRRALAQALARLLGDSNMRSRLGNAARQTIEARFSLVQTAAHYLDLYQELIDFLNVAALAR